MPAFLQTIFQKDISEFPGVSIGFISAIEREDTKIPAEHLARLLSNDNGWDTKYLTNGCCGTKSPTCAQ